MNKILLIIGLAVFMQACGSGDEATAVSEGQIKEATDEAMAEVQETVNKALSGQAIGSAEEGTEACEYFESGLITELFGVDAASVLYKRTIPIKRFGHVLCMARWDNPKKAELKAAYQDSIREWSKSFSSGEKKAKPNYPSTHSDVSVTLVADKFSSPAEAVASLDSMIATLSKGVTTNIDGKEITTQMKYEPPIEGLGDKAVFTEDGTLHLAYNAKRMTVSVSISGANDPMIKRQETIRLAQRLIAGN